MKREVDAPAADWLTEEEAAQYLRVNSLVFRHLVDSGWVPGEVRHSRECVLFPWEGILVVSLRLKLGDRPPERERENPKKPGKTGQNPGKLDETGREN